MRHRHAEQPWQQIIKAQDTSSACMKQQLTQTRLSHLEPAPSSQVLHQALHTRTLTKTSLPKLSDTIYRDHFFKTGRDSCAILQEQTLKVKQNGEMEEYALNERTKKTPKKNPNEIDICNLPDKELKEMIMRILNKLESTTEELRGPQQRHRKYNKE